MPHDDKSCPPFYGPWRNLSFGCKLSPPQHPLNPLTACITDHRNGGEQSRVSDTQVAARLAPLMAVEDRSWRVGVLGYNFPYKT